MMSAIACASFDFAFALLLTKVTKPSQEKLLFRAVSGTHYG
jgi:hypothetical protein